MTTWDESKRLKNIREHGFDFPGCGAIWDNFTITREDVRQSYGEKRLVTFGLLEGTVAALVYTERRAGLHIISLREAVKHEKRYYFEIAKSHFK